MRIKWFADRVPDLHVCKSVKEFKDYINSKPLIDYIFFDHDLGEGENGVDAAKFLVEKFGATNNWGLIHSWNKAGAAAMQNCGLRVPHVPFGEFELEMDDKTRIDRIAQEVNRNSTWSDGKEESRLRSEQRSL